MTDFFFTQTAAELQANHDKVSAVNGGIVGTNDDFQPPINNTWNGYLDPEHQSGLPAPNGYPGNSGGGEAPYTADQEISFGIFAGASGSTVSSDSDGWIFTNSIYRTYDYTTAQLADIDINAVPVYLKGQDGSEHFVNNATTGVNVTKPDANTLKVEITDAIFAELGITKLWRWFDTERVGRVVELSADSFLDSIQESLRLERTIQDLTSSRSPGVTYTNNTATEKFISVRMSSSAANASIVATVNDGSYTTGTAEAGITNDISFHVPRDGSYSVTVNTGTPALSIWTEETL